jgi:hypothetical protein
LRGIRQLPLSGEELEEPRRGWRKSNGTRASFAGMSLYHHQPGAAGRAHRWFYNHRGTCEQYITEGEGAIKWTRLSCPSFAADTVSPWALSPGV